jgi:hypothetical protein
MHIPARSIVPPPGIAADIIHNTAFQTAGWVLTVLITIIGIRMVLYWTSFTFQPGRYRHRVPVSTGQLRHLAREHVIPNIKVQFTTKGSPGSTEVILRGIRQLEKLAAEDPEFYALFLSAEVVTENPEQAETIGKAFVSSPLARVDCVVTPESYATPKGTQLKAKQMHYLVELRRAGWNYRPGRTFIVHFDEDTLMVPDEFRKMVRHLTLTGKKVLTGPIYYPLEYDDASRLARATEATRPITCFECRRVMETGVPLHVHGSNLVVEEELENRVGWDIGLMPGREGQPGSPFVAEDYMFGMDVFMAEGKEVFGWHGAVAWEQPPFSFPSVYRQRYRWVFGVLQGMSVDTVIPAFRRLPWLLRMKVIWGTRYRISTYALGTVVGTLSLMYMPFALTAIILQEQAGNAAGPAPWLDAWFALVGVMWLGANMMGAWMNALHTGRDAAGIMAEVTRAVVISPVAGLMENMAAMRAVTAWMLGARGMTWHTTPSTKAADDALRGRAPGSDRVTAEALMPSPGHAGSAGSLIPMTVTATAIVAGYVGTPLLLATQEVLRTHAIVIPVLIAAVILSLAITGVCARTSRLTMPQRGGRHRLGTVPSPADMRYAALPEPDTIPIPAVSD